MKPRHAAILGATLLVALALRAYQVGRLSYWYDEVVTIRLARTPDLPSLLNLLGRIDATRAPLHPIVLQQWTRLFGPSEATSRALSVLCGVLTVAWVGHLGRKFFDDTPTGLWAAWLAAVSPLLIVYSRETRMYAWLTLITCASWDAMITPTRWRPIFYPIGLAALTYSHPLGLLMAPALGLASLLSLGRLGISSRAWVGMHTLAVLAVLPWAGHYFDHAPESLVGRLPLRFLLGTPIGFVGGNFVTLAGFLVVIIVGLAVCVRDRGRWPRVRLDNPTAALCLLLWLTFPPALLYGYSLIGSPIFGPARYTLFVAPAFLILVARGLAKLPRLAGVGVGLAATVLAVMTLPSMVYAPDLKADWRGAASEIDRLDPERTRPVVVVSADETHNVEVETARYYLGDARRIVPDVADGLSRYWLAVGMRHGVPTTEVEIVGPTIDRPGLRLIAVGE